MYLNKEQEEMLKGKYGWITAKALELIVKVGEIVGAEELVPVKHVHVSGVSYINIGKYGLEYIVDFYKKGGRARVYTTINPSCIDYSGFSSVIDNSNVDSQLEIDNALIKMGFKPVFTCIPYYYRPPSPGEHLAWGESSAVIYANSIYGARTNREGGPLTLAASITGYIYKSGLHLPVNRIARIRVKPLSETLNLPIGALGLWIGDNVKKIPYITGLKNMNTSSLKILLSSMAASGSHALAILDNVTPRNAYSVELEDHVEVEKRDLEDYLGDPVSRSDSILGYIGCPHVHPEELMEIARLLKRYNCRCRDRNKLLITVPFEYPVKYGVVINELKARGVDIAAGTCPVVSRLRSKFDVIVTNSGKSVFYLKKIHGVKVRLASTREIVEYVCRTHS